MTTYFKLKSDWLVDFFFFVLWILGMFFPLNSSTSWESWNFFSGAKCHLQVTPPAPPPQLRKSNLCHTKETLTWLGYQMLSSPVRMYFQKGPPKVKKWRTFIFLCIQSINQHQGGMCCVGVVNDTFFGTTRNILN